MNECVSIRVVLTVTAWIGGAALLAAGWLAQLPILSNAGLVASLLGATLLLMHDNAQTRRVVRVALREFDAGRPPADVRSVR